ncbi:MAG: septation protein IspZ [Deltaproteobacteria bacterium]|nr:septation protein IspZ [Deltaproteobacteria bacterium]MBN2672011.1 septation protein IspZ [Deltaproteobacteria bacterium]
MKPLPAKKEVDPLPQKMNPMWLMMTQLLPLIVFIVVDAIVTDVRISILCAVLFAVGQLIVTFVTTRRFEWLVLVDVALISVLGGISIVSQNDLFFKVKPAVIEGLAVLFFGGLMFAPESFLIRYFSRMTPGASMKPEAVRMLKQMLVVMCIATLVHIGAVLGVAFYASKEVWAAVSGPGFYAVVLPPMAVMVVIKRRRAK